MSCVDPADRNWFVRFLTRAALFVLQDRRLGDGVDRSTRCLFPGFFGTICERMEAIYARRRKQGTGIRAQG